MLGTLIANWLTQLTTGISESPLKTLISTVGGVGSLILVIYFQRYVKILGADPLSHKSPEGQAYNDLRESLERGGTPALIYARLLKGFLGKVDHFFGDPKEPDPTCFSRLFGLKNKASLWTAPALEPDRKRVA